MLLLTLGIKPPKDRKRILFGNEGLEPVDLQRALPGLEHFCAAGTVAHGGSDPRVYGMDAEPY